MVYQTLVSLLGGTAGILCLIYLLLGRRKKVKLVGKVVLITGANSGLGKGNFPVIRSLILKTVTYLSIGHLRCTLKSTNHKPNTNVYINYMYS